MSQTSSLSARPTGRLARRVITWLVVATSAGLAPASAGAFQLGLQDDGFQSPVGAAAAYRALGAIDGNWVRQDLRWSDVAPTGRVKPQGFDAGDPADPQYNWSVVDAAVRGAAGRHVNLILAADGAPSWAEGPNRPSSPNIDPGAWDPSATEFGQFMHAAAVRYSGHFPDPLAPGADLPRVRHWEIWNEENLPFALAAPNLVDEYRSLLNVAYGAIKAVDRTDVVAIGGLAPVSFLPPLSISPLAFYARLLCLTRVGTSFQRAGSCPEPARFDVLADHPYSLAASPTKHAYNYDDVLVGDMGKLSRLLRTADRLHTVLPVEHHGMWVTEWSWFTNPPNTTIGDSPSIAARYTAYSSYEMWKAGVSVVIWFKITDPGGSSETDPGFVAGGALYDGAGHPKPMMRAFTFPFVAGVAHGRGFGWGRAPVAARQVVTVQRRQGPRWLPVAMTRTLGDGTFSVRFRAGGNADYRASVTRGPTSLAYDSAPIRPRRTHAFYSG